MRKKSSGILLPISALPGKRGIGSFGDEARKFVDFLAKSKQTYWQILPLGHTSFGDSPYQSFSTFAGNPYFIDLDYLVKDGLLNKEELDSVDWKCQEDHVNYDVLYQKRYPLLRKAVSCFKDNAAYKRFLKENDWLEDYALFMAIKGKFNGCDWLNWPKEYRLREKETIDVFKKEYKEDIRFWKVVQFLFAKQWFALKKYANKKNIRIFGDCPIYVALDSADVWSKKENFKLKDNGIPREVAGVPPDYFSELGQLWGNPLYNWNLMKKDHYSWWVKRVKYLLTLYDAVRIDHFIGIESYYAIKYGYKDARIGKRYKGPGYSLIKEIKKEMPDGEIIAEDLGVVTDDVRKLLKKSGYPGMKVMRYAFDGSLDNEHLTCNHKENMVIYITSHDSETCMQWESEARREEIEFARSYSKMKDDTEFNWGMIEELERSPAYLVIIQAQDILGLNKEARMNFPGTLGNNWAWRLKENQLDDDIALRLKKIVKKNGRI